MLEWSFSESEKQKKINASLIKKITGNDTMRCRPLYGNTIEFTPICKMIMMTNFKPEIDTDDQAILDRLKYVPY